MVIAETKRQMHETLEMKEEEIVQLRAHIKQLVMQSEELKEQKEKSEKAGKKCWWFTCLIISVASFVCHFVSSHCSISFISIIIKIKFIMVLTESLQILYLLLFLLM